MIDAILVNFPMDFKSFVERERRKPETIALSILLYQQGLSLRRVEELLSYLDEDLTYRGVHRWIQKLGRQEIWDRGDDLPPQVVIDETVVKIGSDHWYLYAAIAPENRKIVYASIYPSRNFLTTKSFFREMMRKYGEKSEEIATAVDGGPWYKIVGRLGIKRNVVSGDIGNYIERWFQTLKRRLNNFYCYFPESKNVQHANRWLKTCVFYHNNMRKHQGLDWKTPKEVLN